jgi:hypothetical protein
VPPFVARDGRYERTYYTLRSHQYQLQQQRPIVGPFWAREFEAAHRAIDDDPLSLRASSAHAQVAGDGATV